MTPQELREFMSRHGLTYVTLAALLGVTDEAVKNWLGEKRTISITIKRLLGIFDKYPELVKEFAK